MNALDPVYTIAAQMREAMAIHGERGRARTLARIREVSELVGLPPDRLADYPHQLSGRMKQRACIGMALLLNPRLLIADEPTTALDVMLQQQVVRTIRELQERLRLAVIYISHDISIVAALCRKVAVMYAGEIVEAGRVERVLGSPCHPYTMGLQHAVPTPKRRSALVSIPGAPPDPRIPPPGCRFESRCPFRSERCREEEPALYEVNAGQAARCFYVAEAARFRELAARQGTWT
jgi:oligopeptide/dipeptide ABC transporter ATP-binding protein